MPPVVHYAAVRLSEASSWAGIAGVLGASGLMIPDGLWHWIALVGMGVAGLVAYFVPDERIASGGATLFTAASGSRVGGVLGRLYAYVVTAVDASGHPVRRAQSGEIGRKRPLLQDRPGADAK
jgi:hypothetical protein